MNLVLYKEMMKQQSRTIFSYGFATILYQWLLQWVYPTLASNTQINDLLKNLPPALSRFMNVQGGMNSLPQYMSSEFYNIIWPLILAVFTIGLAGKLIAGYVEKQSMAQLLATQLTRTGVALTQAMVLISGVAILAICSFAGLYIGAKMFGEEFALGAFFHMTVTSVLLFLVIGGYSYLLSCLLDDSRQVVGAAGALTGVFYILQMASQMAPNIDWMSHLSLFWFYQPSTILESGQHIWWHDGVLCWLAIGLFWAGQRVFRVRSLAL